MADVMHHLIFNRPNIYGVKYSENLYTCMVLASYIYRRWPKAVNEKVKRFTAFYPVVQFLLFSLSKPASWPLERSEPTLRSHVTFSAVKI